MPQLYFFDNPVQLLMADVDKVEIQFLEREPVGIKNREEGQTIPFGQAQKIIVFSADGTASRYDLRHGEVWFKQGDSISIAKTFPENGLVVRSDQGGMACELELVAM